MGVQDNRRRHYFTQSRGGPISIGLVIQYITELICYRSTIYKLKTLSGYSGLLSRIFLQRHSSLLSKNFIRKATIKCSSHSNAVICAPKFDSFPLTCLLLWKISGLLLAHFTHISSPLAVVYKRLELKISSKR